MPGVTETKPFGCGFADLVDNRLWDEMSEKIRRMTSSDVKAAISKARRNSRELSVDDFMALVSPAAENYMEEMAALSMEFTRERFGKTISLYIPMYVSNACTNKCVYCGFNHDNPLARTTLTMEQINAECRAIRRLGPFENLLIVSGEYPALCGVDYLEKALKVCRPYFHNLSIEVMPLKQRDYERLVESGLYGVVCFQETYNRNAYPLYHPRGMKSFYDWRLNGYDRMGRAGVHKIGLGVLLGLEDWRTDTAMMAMHLRYLQKNTGAPVSV